MCSALTIWHHVVGYPRYVGNESLGSLSNTPPDLSARHKIKDASISINLPAMVVAHPCVYQH